MSIYSVNLIPAYGRDYKYPSEVVMDWKAGKDFMIADIGNRWNGKYTSIRDWEGEAVRIRYNRLADFVIIGANGDAE
jgi:hypothetical protein